MASLGDLGVVKPKVIDSFGWFGQEIRINPNLTDIVLMDFAEKAAAIDEDSPEVMGFVKMQMRLVVYTEDFDAFWSAALENGQDSTDLMAVMKTIVESTAKRPTQLPAGSSAGQPRTVVTSPDVSSLPDTEASPLAEADRESYREQVLTETRAKLLQFRDEARPWLTPADRRAIEAKAGRPDVQAMIDESARQRWMESGNSAAG
jgi:hypothetical protein